MRCLIVDDDYVSRIKIKTILSVYGDCDAVPSGELALALVENSFKEEVPYSIITVDVDMPDMRGAEVIESIRKIEETYFPKRAMNDKILVITITGHQSAKEVLNTVYVGADFLIIKPVTPDKIKSTIGR